MSRFSRPLIALALAVIPFFLFIGTTSTVTVNGETVSDSRFNIAGLVMAVIGIGLVFGVLRSSRDDTARKALAAVAGLLCLVQIASSLDVVRIDPLGWIFPDRHLPELQYSGLAENDYIYLSVKTPSAYRGALAGKKGDMIAQAREHRAYADKCHGGRYRADLERAERMPDYFEPDHLPELERRAGRPARAVECSTERSERMMGKEVDDLNRQMDLFDRLEAEYLALSE